MPVVVSASVFVATFEALLIRGQQIGVWLTRKATTVGTPAAAVVFYRTGLSASLADNGLVFMDFPYGLTHQLLDALYPLTPQSALVAVSKKRIKAFVPR
ncbi:hypothetical protein D3C72_1484520 [compost metagenome]